MGKCVRACRLLPTLLRRYWFTIAWTAACVLMFFRDYSRYKKEPQYYYIRRMLGIGLCISRGSAAVLNLSCCCLVLPMCRGLTTALSTALSHSRQRPPTLPAALAAPATHTAKTTHLVMVATVFISAVVHSTAHMANAYNSSRYFSYLYPDLNLASYKGESPLRLFTATVPGITGVLMVVVLGVMGVSSLGRVRHSHYNLFYYTHHLGLIFLLLMVLHPLKGVLKEQRNLHSHFPGCQMHMDTQSDEEGFPEPIAASESFFTHRNITDSPLGNSFRELQQDYGFPEPSSELQQDYGFPEPSLELQQDYGFPEPSPELQPHYEFPEPSPELDLTINEGYDDAEYENVKPFSAMSYEYPEPATELDYPEVRHNKMQQNSDQKALPHIPSLKNHNHSRESAKQGGVMIKVQQKKPLHTGGRKCLRAPEFVPVPSQTWMWVSVALGMWVLDWVVRWLRQRMRGDGQGALVCRVTFLPCSVLRLSLSLPDFTCKPGQYVLIQCPQVSRMEWHPFTVISCDSESSQAKLTVLMQARGDWTQRVASLLHSQCCHKEISWLSHHTPSFSSHTASSGSILQNHWGHSHFNSLPHKYHKSPEVTDLNSSYTAVYLGNSQDLLTVATKKSYSLPPYVGSDRNEIHIPVKGKLPVSLSPCAKSASHSSMDTGKFNFRSYLKGIVHPVISKSKPRVRVERTHVQHNRSSICSHCHLPHFGTHSHPSPHKVYCDKNPQGKGCYVKEWSLEAETENIPQNEHFVVSSPVGSYVRFHIDGPFSSPCEVLLGYPVVIGTAGGMGITPLAASLYHIRECPSKWPVRVHVVWVVRNARLLLAVAPLLLNLLHQCWEAHKEDRLELRLHVTRYPHHHTIQELLAEYPALLPRITGGRPQWKHLFQEWRHTYRRTSVGVFACGPSQMRRQVKRHCLNAVARGSAFYYHQESFS